MKVSLLGDSIRWIGYGLKVPELLAPDFEVFQPGENCRYSKYTMRMLYDARGAFAGSRIVHWNNGHWDNELCFGDGYFTPDDEYVSNMSRIADILLSRHEKVIFATTTPTKGHPNFPCNDIIVRRNALIVPILKEKGVIINDLYSFVSENIDEYIKDDDKIHLSEAGIDAVAHEVADFIRKVAKTLD